MTEQTQPDFDSAAIIRQAREIMESFRELEQVLIEANKAMTQLSAALYYACQTLEEKKKQADPAGPGAAYSRPPGRTDERNDDGELRDGAPGMDGLTPEARIIELSEKLEWALDLIDLYDRRLSAIDGPEEVYSADHVQAKEAARLILVQRPFDDDQANWVAANFLVTK